MTVEAQVENRSCAGCKHHSKVSRPTVRGVADGDMELIEEDDELLEIVFSCRHPDVKNGATCAIGLEAAEKLAAECPYYVAGTAGKQLSERMQKLLDASAARHGSE